MKMKGKILIIDDEPIGYQQIKLLIPSDYDIYMESEMETVSIRIFSNFALNEKLTYDFIKKTLSQNYKQIRMIICDLQLGGDPDAGYKIINEIKQWDATADLKLPKDFSWYLKFIPIECCSKLPPNDVNKTSLAGASFYNKPPLVITNEYEQININYDKCRLKTTIERFSFQCESKGIHCPYLISISYSRKDNNLFFIGAIAEALYQYYGKERVFVDLKKPSGVSGTTEENQQLQKIYSDNSQFILVVLSPKYGRKSSWTEKEWQAIKKREDKDRSLIFIKGKEMNHKEIQSLKERLGYVPLTPDDGSLAKPTFSSDPDSLETVFNDYCKKIQKQIVEDIIIKKISDEL